MVDRPRRHADPREAAEAVFRKAVEKPVDVVAPTKPAIPVGREAVTLRIDRDVLERFQEDGPGWQDRINAALRTASGLG